MARIRGIFAKLVFVFLTVGLVPFLAVGLWTWRQAKTRVTEASVESWLVRIARETAAQIDRETERMREAALAWADEEQTVADARAAARPGPDGAFAAQRLTSALGRRAELFGDVPVACVVSPDGRILAANGSDRSLPASALGGRRLDEVFDDAAERAWIDAVFAQPAPGPVSRRNWHRSPLADAAVSAANPSTRRHEIGFAAPVRGGFGAPDGRPAAALVVLFRFEPIQRVLDQVTGRFADHAVDDAAPRYPSGYPFLFDADGDTVIAHRDRALVGSSLVRDHGQRGFSEAMRGRRYGFHHYEYPPGVGKISGFARCADEASGGFGWIVGVGVNHADVFADVDALRDVLLPAALIIAGCVLLLAALFSARITEPLRRLVLFTEQVARGNYDARVEPTTRDELAVVADAFNRMAADLKESGRRLIEAEKNAAWKEMARQVAHEIKNPLTPIMLSAQQVERALDDRHPRFDEIARESLRNIVEQCESLKRIAQNFASFAAFPQSRKERRAFGRLVADAVRLYAPERPDGPRVVVSLDVPRDVHVLADEDELRRVFLNLFNNAFEAMGPTGTLSVAASVRGEEPDLVAQVRICDTGRGISEEHRERLFEPYFSTRTGGTGLGLAICRKIMHGHRGDVAFEPAPGGGACFVLTLPCFRTAGAGEASSDPFGDTRTVHRG